MGIVKFLALVLLLSHSYALAEFKLQNLTADKETIQKDLELILKKANLTKNAIKFTSEESRENIVRITCSKNIKLEVRGTSSEWGSTFYLGLQKLGFLFPHPRIQISPTLKDMRAHCGKVYKWRPALRYRGFHLHTLHAGEWVDGFLMGKKQIAVDLVRWLARNQQTIFDLWLLRMNDKEIFDQLNPLFKLARKLGIHTGVTVGIAFHQQNAYKLVSLWGSLFDSNSLQQIKENLPKLIDNLPLSFVNVEMGTSEFTGVNYDRMLKWLNLIGKMTRERNLQVVTKIHTSTNQKNKKYGNFNFLPQYADSSVGILPHTVFYHALNDPHAPLYGNKNFAYMRDFMIKENKKRMTWYYPETSYYIALDIDLPLLLVEYLRTRSEDMKLLYQNKIAGQLNFSTGQENGYWLMDWTVALSNNLDYNFDPMIGLKLLGETHPFWKKWMDFQQKYFTNKGLISIVTFSNGGDELAPAHKILQRNLMAELARDSKLTRMEISQLKEAIIAMPAVPEGIHDELGTLAKITNLRLPHALYVRQALLNKNKHKLKAMYLGKAREIREQAQNLMNKIIKKYNRYPESFVYKRMKNPSSYPFGYGFASSNLHFWKREEMMVKHNNFSVFYMNIWDFLDIVI